MRIHLTGLSSGELVPRGGSWPGVGQGIGRFGVPVCIAATTICESTGQEMAKVVFYDGSDNTGEVILPITLRPNESTRDVYVTDRTSGLEVYSGSIYYEVTGAIEGSVEVV